MLPNLIIIGAMKSATTSLHYYLNLHPQIRMSRSKELDFFIEERNWRKGVAWYESNFDGDAEIHGEASPNYTNHPLVAGVPQRMHSVVPDAKLIYILRDPIERIISHYLHNVADGRERRTLGEALENLDDNNKYFCRSQYHRQLEQYLAHYPAARIHITTREELYAARLPTLRKVFRFLDVDESFHCDGFANLRHQSSYKRRKTPTGERLARTSLMRRFAALPPEWRWHFDKLIYYPFSRKIERPVIDENLRRRLVDNLKDDVDRLRQHTGRDFAEWGFE